MERLLPQNIDAECGVLGSIIIDPEAVMLVADWLRPDDFYRDAHRTIYKAIVDLYETHAPADFITLCERLEQQNHLEQIGGASYLTSLISGVPTSGNAIYYAQIVAQKAGYRRLIHAAGRIAALAYEETEGAQEQTEQLLFSLKRRTTRDFISLEGVCWLQRRPVLKNVQNAVKPSFSLIIEKDASHLPNGTEHMTIRIPCLTCQSTREALPQSVVLSHFQRVYTVKMMSFLFSHKARSASLSTFSRRE